MNSHLINMRKSYQSHIQLLSNVIEEERATLNLVEIQKWSNLFAKCSANEELKEKTKIEREQFYQQEINRIHLEHMNKTDDIRKNMMNDYDQLQIDIQLMKAKCMRNSEKFDYNLQVLEKKVIENGIINNQERKRLCKLQETLRQLKQNISNEREKFASCEKMLIKDISRFGERMEEFENRADRYAKINDKKVVEFC